MLQEVITNTLKLLKFPVALSNGRLLQRQPGQPEALRPAGITETGIPTPTWVVASE